MAPLFSQWHLFDIPDHVAYFNTASNSPQLNASRDRLHAGVTGKSRPWLRTSDDFFEDADTLRQLAAELFGGSAEAYAIIPSASYGIATAARALEPELGPGDRILVIEDIFPSNYLAWQRSAAETGAELTVVPIPEDGDWTTAVLERLDASVRVAALPHCHWTNGAFIDLVAVGRACRSRGISLVVDATQSLGAMPMDMDEIRPDFLTAAGYKWLLAPYGFSLLYVDSGRQDARPLEETWIARDNARNFSELVNYSSNYMAGARRFDVGETCVPTVLPGAIAALEQIRDWGVANIAETLAAVNGTIISCLEELGFDLPPKAQRSPHMFGAGLPAHYQGDLVGELMARDIYISRRGNALRFSPHLHVRLEDVARLTSELTDLIRG